MREVDFGGPFTDTSDSTVFTCLFSINHAHMGVEETHLFLELWRVHVGVGHSYHNHTASKFITILVNILDSGIFGKGKSIIKIIVFDSLATVY